MLSREGVVLGVLGGKLVPVLPECWVQGDQELAGWLLPCDSLA